MAVPKLSSEDLNTIMLDSKQQITNIETKLAIAKEDIENKLRVIRCETDYISSKLDVLYNGGYDPDLRIKTFADNAAGQFDLYGSTVHAKFIKAPVNVFNLQTLENLFFRKDVTVLINDQSADRFNSILEHENSPTKLMFFEEFQTNMINLEINVDYTSALGSTRFNIIELSPFMPGSFDIASLQIYSINEDGTLNNTPDTYGPILSVGKERIILPKKYGFFKIKMAIVLNYEPPMRDTPTYAFGFKHIYFYNADFAPSSFAIVSVTKPNYISIIKDEISIMTPFTSSPNGDLSTIGAEGIEVYLDLVDGVLKTPVYVSTPSQRNEVVRNTKRLYFKVPLPFSDDEDSVINSNSLIGIAFNIETRTV